MSENKSAVSALARALIYTKLASEYFDFFIVESGIKFDDKHFIKSNSNKLKAVLRDMGMVVSPGVRDAYVKDMDNAPAVDSIANIYLTLSEENRVVLEDYAEELLKSQKK